MSRVRWGGGDIPGVHVSGLLGEALGCQGIYIAVVEEDEGVVRMCGRDNCDAHD
jgi:hypothetical protein